jgi:2-C-methyl-D-erythritol 4-phosphate cytidylyltransferase
VYQGIQAVGGGCDIVVIHDAVRPFVTPLMIESCVTEARLSGACIIGMPMMETAKRVISGEIESTLDRSTIWMAQTPQTFTLDLIRTAHEKARRDRFIGTDDAMLVERLKRMVRILPGSRLNIKITTPEDVVMAEGIIHLMPTGFN